MVVIKRYFWLLLGAYNIIGSADAITAGELPVMGLLISILCVFEFVVWQDTYLHEAGHATVAAALYFAVDRHAEISIVSTRLTSVSSCMLNLPRGVLDNRMEAVAEAVICCGGLAGLALHRPMYRWHVLGASGDYWYTFKATDVFVRDGCSGLRRLLARVKLVFVMHRTAKTILRNEPNLLMALTEAIRQHGGNLPAAAVRAIYEEHEAGNDYLYNFRQD